jgi:GTPase
MSLKLVITGRPNVGKSTLFNRLAGRKLALVHDRPGVTRDRREGFGRFGDMDLSLVDTAGLETAKSGLEADMRTQTLQAVGDADVCLFLVDARTGIMPLDEIFADILRKSGCPVVLVANKTEGRAGRDGLLDAFSLGLGEPVAVSAEHNEGMGELFVAIVEAAKTAGLDTLAEEDEDDSNTPLRIAVIGRPNAGKSTLINGLIGEDRLITGPEAGITRDSIAVDWSWDGRPVRLADTAGMRKRAKITDHLEKMAVSDSLKAIMFAEVVVVVMDALSPLDKQDMQLADLAEREGRAVVFAVTKWDLVKDKAELLAHLKERLNRLLPQLRGAPLVTLSGLTGRGLKRLMPAIEHIHKDWNAKVKTRDLNDWLHAMTQRHPAPAVQGRRIKPRYISQTKSRPPTFVLMCSRAKYLPVAYKRYLINGLRDDFDLMGVPIRLIVKAGNNPYEGKKPES